MPAPQEIQPTNPDARLPVVDTVRGFALFGVLLVNMFNFGAYSQQWSGLTDQVFSVGVHALLETKSLRLFSILFGIGFALQLAKKGPGRRAGALWLYGRRLLILFFFGMAHALFYDGDILMEYAMLGILLVAFRNVGTRALLILVFALLAAFPLGNLLYPEGDEASAAHWEDALSLEELREDHPYLGAPMDVFRENVNAIPPHIWSNLQGPESSLMILSMLLLGLYLGKAGIVHNVDSHLLLIRRVFRWGVGLGAASAVAEWWLSREYGYAVYTAGAANAGVRFLGDVLFAYGSTALALGCGAGIILLWQAPGWASVLRPLQSVGRMALTAYLASTLMFTTLFYGWGFGQLFLLGPVATTIYAAIFFVVLAIFCTWWLRRFRFGPAEWLWRSLAYRKRQPMRL